MNQTSPARSLPESARPATRRASNSAGAARPSTAPSQATARRSTACGTSPHAWVCLCKGCSSRQTCCHTLAAALPRCSFCDAATDVHRYRNPYEAEPITLCGACAGEAAR